MKPSTPLPLLESSFRTNTVNSMANLKEFTVELSSWWLSLSHISIQYFINGLVKGFGIIEYAKKRVVSTFVPRDSVIGRPFSPLGIGGLTAGIALGGALLGHSVDTNSSTKTTSFPSLKLQTAAAAPAPFSNDMMVDTSRVKTIIPENRTRTSLITHIVAPGDTIQSIAQKYNISADSLRYANNIELNDTLKQGQSLIILPVSGVLYTVRSGDTVESIANKWKIPAQALVDMNWLDEPYIVTIGQKLVLPNAEIPKPVAPTKLVDTNSSGLTLNATSNKVSGTGKFLFPTSGQITQGYSYYHNGIDIGAMGAAPAINAADNGKVTFAGWWEGGGGNSVWVDHGNGYVTMYAHMSRITVSVGQYVTRGQQVGVMGETGRAFGVHLHFQVEQNGKVINPLSVL